MNKQKLHTTRCKWCSKLVSVKRGRLTSHLTPGGIKCVGVGQPAKTCAPKL